MKSKPGETKTKEKRNENQGKNNKIKMSFPSAY